MNKKGFISPHISLLILVSVLVGAGVYFYTNGSLTNVLSAKDIRVGRLAQNSLVAVPATRTFIEIQAWGTMLGSEPPKIALDIKGDQAMYTFVSDRSTSYNYTYEGAPLRPEDIRVRFMNDFTDPSGASRNVKIDYIKLNGVKYESEHESVLSTGTWSTGDKCATGYKKSDWLHCNGYFQYASIESDLPDLNYQRLTDTANLVNQTFTEHDGRYNGKYAKGYVFRLNKNTPYALQITDYKAKYDNSDYIDTYLFDANNKLITAAQTNLAIREDQADLRKPYSGIPPTYEGDVYVIVTNKFNDVRTFTMTAYDELKVRPVILVRDTVLNKKYNISAKSAFNRKYTLPVKTGVIIVDLKKDANILLDPNLEVKVYTLEGTYFEHIQKFIEDGTFNYMYAKNYGREIPVTVVRINYATLEIYSKEDKKPFPSSYAGPFEFPSRSQIQVEYTFAKSQPAPFVRSMTFWTK